MKAELRALVLAAIFGAVTAHVIAPPSGAQASVEAQSPIPIREISGASSQLNRPSGIAVDADGYVYVANMGGNSIAVYPPSLAGSASAPVKSLMGAATELTMPRALAFDSTGKLYVVNSNSVTVYAAGFASGNTAPVKVLRGSNTQLIDPRGVTFDPTDRMYIVNSYEGVSYETREQVGSITVYPRDWPPGNSQPEAVLQGPLSLLNRPYALAFDSLGFTYVANRDSITVYRPSWAGGDLAPMYRIEGSSTRLARPTSLAIDENDLLYVANSSSNAITTYELDWLQSDLAPVAVLGGDAELLSRPSSIALDDRGHVNVTNEAANRVTVFVPSLVKVMLDVNGGIPLRRAAPFTYSHLLSPQVEIKAGPVLVAADSTEGSAIRISSVTPSVCEGEGDLQAQLSLKRPGTCTVKTQLVGGAPWAPAPVVFRSFTVRASTQTIQVPALRDVPLSGRYTTVRVTSSSSLPVTLISTTPSVCIASSAWGHRIELRSAGTCRLLAFQPGNEYWNATTTELTFQIVPAVAPKLEVTCKKLGRAPTATIACQGTSVGIKVGSQLQVYTRTASTLPWTAHVPSAPVVVDVHGYFEWQTRVGAQRSLELLFAWGEYKGSIVKVKWR